MFRDGPLRHAVIALTAISIVCGSSFGQMQLLGAAPIDHPQVHSFRDAVVDSLSRSDSSRMCNEVPLQDLALAGVPPQTVAFAEIDHAARVLLPLALDAAGDPATARRLRSSSPITNAASARSVLARVPLSDAERSDASRAPTHPVSEPLIAPRRGPVGVHAAVAPGAYNGCQLAFPGDAIPHSWDASTPSSPSPGEVHAAVVRAQSQLATALFAAIDRRSDDAARSAGQSMRSSIAVIAAAGQASAPGLDAALQTLRDLTHLSRRH